MSGAIVRLLAHVETCRQCSHVGRELCAEGERLREEAGEAEAPMPVEHKPGSES